MSDEIVLSVRRYVAMLEYEGMCSWWETAGMPSPRFKDVPDTTLVCEVNGLPMLYVSLILTNVSLGWVDNFIARPGFSGPLRRDATRFLLEQLEKLALETGHERLFCMATNEELNCYYTKLGFTTTCHSVFTLIKELNNHAASSSNRSRRRDRRVRHKREDQR